MIKMIESHGLLNDFYANGLISNTANLFKFILLLKWKYCKQFHSRCFALTHTVCENPESNKPLLVAGRVYFCLFCFSLEIETK